MIAAFATSAAIAATAAVLAVLAAVPAGLVLGRRSFRGKATVEVLLLVPAAVP